MKFKTTLISGSLLLISSSFAFAVQTQHWFDQQTVNNGKNIFLQNCASCHGDNGEASNNWQQADSNGQYSPPPLNGSAHAWHHSMDTLKQTVRDGGQKLGGVMPAFADKLSEADIEAAISFFQSKWPDDIYSKWSKRFQIQNFKPVKVAAVEPVKTETFPDSNITKLLQMRLGGVAVSAAKPTPVEGMYQTQFGSKYAYLTSDGRYVFIGDLIDLKNASNLTELSRRESVTEQFAKVAVSDFAIFPAKGEEKASISVFTDTSCPYCKKLHEEVPKLQDAGITVRYLPFPRGGTRGPGYNTLKQVWCAKDKAEAMNIAKNVSVGDLPAGDCAEASLVDRGYELGNSVGVTGTPSIFKSNGEKIDGYVPFKQLIPRVLTSK